MIWFIAVLRVVAACLITNSHYAGVYPISAIASGGLIGDIIFFAVSGYCLCNVKTSFPRWYGKRVLRCYVPVILITVVYMLLGYFSFCENSWTWWFVYPTYYHFVASIILLYIPFYFFMRINWIKKRIPLMMILIAVIYVLLYLFAYDKRYYHIDCVEEPLIRFLFLESMLLGAYLRQKKDKHCREFSWWSLVAVMLLGIAYFGSKIMFDAVPSLASLQIINQFVIFALLYAVFRLFASMECWLNRWPKWLKKCVEFCSKLTLEIYVVQYFLIASLSDVAPFPVNWVCVSTAILCGAIALHFIASPIIKGIEWLAEKTELAVRMKKTDQE